MSRRAFFPIAAVLLGLTAVLLVSEALLRGASFFVDRRSRANIGRAVEGEVRITCVGESTTWGAWPADLEAILNQDNPGTTYRVVNRGMVGARTDVIADAMEGWLDEDRPDIVIAMLGINDEGNVLVYPRSDTPPWLVEHLKTAELLSLLYRSAFAGDPPEGPVPDAPSAEAHLDEPTRRELTRLWNLVAEMEQDYRLTDLARIRREILVTDPSSPAYNIGLLRGVVMLHDTPERIDEILRQMVGVDLNSTDDDAKLRAIDAWAGRTGDQLARLRLSTSLARHAKNADLERRILEAAIDDPDLAGPARLRRAELAVWGEGQDQVHRYLELADEAFPDDYQWSLVLGAASFNLGVPDLAAVHYRRALDAWPDLPPSHELLILGRLRTALMEAGESGRAAAVRARRDEIGLSRFREFTRYHYRRVVDTARARGITVIAMQYPMLSVESLRKLLDDRGDVIYLENRANFERAIAERSYHEIFVDSFAGSFGHLSDVGNQLIAENVASVIEGAPPDSVERP